MSLNSGAHRGQFNDTVFEVLGAENSKNDVVELCGGGGEWEVTGDGGGVQRHRFREVTVFEVLGAENSKNDVVELWGGGVGVTEDGRLLGTRGEFNDTVFEVLGAENEGGGVTGDRSSRATRGEFNDTAFEVLGAENSKTMSLNSGVGGSWPKRRIHLVERCYSQQSKGPWNYPKTVRALSLRVDILQGPLGAKATFARLNVQGGGICLGVACRAQ